MRHLRYLVAAMGTLSAALMLALVSPGHTAAPDPSVKITAPSAGRPVFGVVRVTAQAKNAANIAYSILYVDAQGRAATSAQPIYFDWDTTKVSNGEHFLTIDIFDNVGWLSSSAPLGVVVSNPPLDGSAPPVVPTPTPSPTVTPPAAKPVQPAPKPIATQKAPAVADPAQKARPATAPGTKAPAISSTTTGKLPATTPAPKAPVVAIATPKVPTTPVPNKVMPAPVTPKVLASVPAGTTPAPGTPKVLASVPTTTTIVPTPKVTPPVVAPAPSPKITSPAVPPAPKPVLPPPAVRPEPKPVTAPTPRTITIPVPPALAAKLTKAVARGATVKLVYGKTEVTLVAPPYQTHNRTMVPIRSLSDLLGGVVSWEDRTAIVALNTHRYSVMPGKDTLTIDGVATSMDAPASLKLNRCYVPVTAWKSLSGNAVAFDAVTKQVTLREAITTKAKTAPVTHP